MGDFFSFDDYGGVDRAPAVWDTPDMSGSGGVSFSSGWDATLQGIAKTAVGVWGQATLLQQNQDGQRYLEGQRYAMTRNQQIGGISPGMLLLIGGVVLVFAMSKG